METSLSITEVCEWFQCEPADVHRFRLFRDHTLFPPPIASMPGLNWFEGDLASWIAWLSDLRDWREAGFDTSELPTPEYLAVEAETQTVPPSDEGSQI